MTESFVIQSDIAELPNVEERVFHFCRECNIGNYYSTISVAALQAVENAIVHGNLCNIEKKVTVSLGTCKGGIFVEVTDEGSGFDISCYGYLPSGNESTGEGIFVMHSLADRMNFSDGGRKVRMEFFVSGIDPADAMERIAILNSHYVLVNV